jgi:hypothetical protein
MTLAENMQEENMQLPSRVEVHVRLDYTHSNCQ